MFNCPFCMSDFKKLVKLFEHIREQHEQKDHFATWVKENWYKNLD